jgi:hypothetical protein
MLCTRADLKKEQETAPIAVNYIGLVNLITVVQNELIVIMVVSYQHYMEYVASVQKGMAHNYDIPLPLLQQNSITHTNTVNYIYKQNNEL